MAEFIMKDLVKREGMSSKFSISSCAMTREEIGNDMYPPAKRILKEKGILFEKRRARLITKRDYIENDYIIYMDNENKYDLQRRFDDVDHKIYPLLSDRSVSDPWWTDDFETCYNDINEGCTLWLKKLLD